MARHYNESDEALCAMSWPRFAARWARLLKDLDDDRRREERRREEQAEDRDWAKLRAAHQQHIRGKR